MQAPLRHLAAGLAALSFPALALADEPLAQRATWEGTIEHFLTGVTLAEDKDKDGDVDQTAQPASFDTNDVPASATLVEAILYWGGTRSQSSTGTECTTASSADGTITVTYPSGTVGTVTADVSWCSGGGASSYDVWVSKADLTTVIEADGGDIRGNWTIEDYVGKYSGGATDNASAALLLVYEEPTLAPRRVVLYDGNQLMESETDTLALSGFDADSTPDGTLTYYVLEGDVGAGSGTEQVEVAGSPGGASLVLSDAINPSNNPMNRTINTTTPTQEGVTGVDIDQFDITSALTAYDTQLDVTYQASTEKWWLVVNVVGVKQYAPFLGELSTKTWTLRTDADGDGQPTPGDTIRYTIHLENSGNESATVDVTDPIPPEADSWVLVNDAGGTDASTAVLLDVRDVSIAASGSADIVFDVVIGTVPDETTMDNTASWSAPLEGGSEGSVTATSVTIRADGDGDGSYTNDDCNDANASIHPGATEDCDGVDQDCDGVGESDGDSDGWLACEECDDADGAVNPGATEVCNGKDDDCDSLVDEGVKPTWYADGDGDGWGGTTTSNACTKPSGYVALGGDCDDARATVNPAATEVCNGRDDDCDGATDESDASDAATWYADGDSDGYGGATTTKACSKPSGYVAASGDCDDTRASVNPGATELCNGRDDDCDGDTDEGVTSTFWADDDGDGFGDSGAPTSACSAPTGYVGNDTDCDDTASTIHPGATETCNSKDDDCDGTVDEGVKTTYYADADGDGWGTTSTTQACTKPSGYATKSGDCDDTRGTVNPDATELCNGRDDDCDGSIDESDASDAATWYADTDADGYGGTTTTKACSKPTGYVATPGDCDDTASTTYPTAPELCDGIDNDCDGAIDEGASGAPTWYADDDGDGYGDKSATTTACSKPTGYVASSTDCDDANAAVNPAALEKCNGIDDDCDGTTDEADATDASTWYADADGDTWGTSTTTKACSKPTGYASRSGDCDDTRGTVNPDATEVCNGRDDDCDGATDESDASDAATWYRDADGDGHGGSTTAKGCSAPTGYVASSDDCDDSDATTYTGATEICDGIDNDCDGVVDDGATGMGTWYADIDEDGYGDPSASTASCSRPTGYVNNDDDCAVADATVNPAATELCNGKDDDCDGATDEADAADADTWYADSDKDGYGSSTTTTACSKPSGYVATSGDCDDAVFAVNPGAAEYCNGRDDDCDGVTDEPDAADAKTWYRDADGDTFGDAAVTDEACSKPGGYVADSTDCDDGDASVWPGATEICDGIDNDCDGSIDEGASGAATWYADTDSDGYGDASAPTTACTRPSGHVGNATDCDDGDSAVNPAATERCNGKDDDCDGATDEADATDATTWYADADKDGYGGATTTKACSAPSGYVATSTDCDDAAAAVHPGATEVCNGIDDDCDASVDEGVETTFWLDADGDGYGDPDSSVLDCTAPSGTVANDDDCDDAAAAVHPGATEACNGVDDDCDGVAESDGDGDGYLACEECDDAAASVNPAAVERCNAIDDDCDGAVDEDASDAPTWYADADVDGYGDASSTADACSAPTGYVADDADCDDADAAVHPGATEACNGLDDDCDGVAEPDADADGFLDCEECDDADATVNPDAAEIAYDGVDQDCDGADLTDVDGDGYAWDGVGGDDCDDTDADVHPGAAEAADGRDEDCDGTVDEGTEFYDDDGDGYTEAGGDCDDADADVAPNAVEACDAVDEDCDGIVDDGTECYDDDGDDFSEAEGDCSDGDPDVHPDMAEIDDNGIDDDCDGSVDGGVYDPDKDGYTSDGGDCEPTDALSYPGADEVCDGVDNDCDGVVDEGTECYDDDGDGWTEAFGDCDDTDSLAHEGADEDPSNGRDDDCDGLVDEGGPSTDDDGDGFTEEGGDCDDYDDAVHPGAEEEENGADDDCDDAIDEDFSDIDGDGYTLTDGDCDDRDGWTNPGAVELCDGLDNNCNGTVDDDVCEDGVVPPEDRKCGCVSPGVSPVGTGVSPALLLVAALLRRRGRGSRR